MKYCLILLYLITFGFSNETQRLQGQIDAESKRLQQEKKLHQSWKTASQKQLTEIKAKTAKLLAQKDSVLTQQKQLQNDVHKMEQQSSYYDSKMVSSAKPISKLLQTLDSAFGTRHEAWNEISQSLHQQIQDGNVKGDEAFAQIWQALEDIYRGGLKVQSYAGALKLKETSLYGTYLQYGYVMQYFVSEQQNKVYWKGFLGNEWKEAQTKDNILEALKIATGKAAPQLVSLPFWVGGNP